MAVIDKTKQSAVKPDAEDEKKGKTVDLLQEKNLPEGEKRKHDITEDAWEFSAPPKAQRFSIKIHPAKDPVTLYQDDKDRPPIYNIAIEGEIVNSTNGEFDKVRVFPRVSTAVGRGKNISTAAGLLVKLGFKIPEEISDKSLATLVLKALMKEPVTDVEVDWQGYSKEEKRVVYRGMHRFPQDENGEPMHIVDYKTKSGSIEEIKANLDVTHWYSKGEKGSIKDKSASAAAGANGGTAIKGTTQLTLARDEEEEGGKPVPVAVKESEKSIEDELTELEEA